MKKKLLSDLDRERMILYVIAFLCAKAVNSLENQNNELYKDLLFKASSVKDYRHFFTLLSEDGYFLRGIRSLFTEDELLKQEKNLNELRDYNETVLSQILWRNLTNFKGDLVDIDRWYILSKEYIIYLVKKSKKMREYINDKRRERNAIARLFMGDITIFEAEQSERSYFGMPLAKNFGKKKASQFWIDFYEDILFSSNGN